MNKAQLFHDVKTRLVSDTGSGSLFPTGGTPLVTGIFNNWANPNQDMPYIVFGLISDVPDDGFDLDFADVLFQLSVFVGTRPADDEKAVKILNRIFGDGIKRAARIPTYGLHRYTFPVTTWPYAVDSSDKWVATACTARGATTNTFEDYIQHVREFNVRLYRTYASSQ